ncbi:MAG: hypothetical protein QW478_01340 [Candidatus Micrarchaeaceae archaeon]
MRTPPPTSHIITSKIVIYRFNSKWVAFVKLQYCPTVVPILYNYSSNIYSYNNCTIIVVKIQLQHCPTVVTTLANCSSNIVHL